MLISNRNFLPNKALSLAGILHFIIIHLKLPENMGDSARELVLQLERVFHREFLVLLDSGYPAFSMIKQSNSSANSKYI